MITTHLSESSYDGATNPPLRLLDDLAIATATSSPNKIGIEEGNAVLNNVDDEGLPESLDDANASLTITTTNQPREHRACASLTTTADNQPRELIVTSPGMGGFRGRTVDSVSAVGENHPKFVNAEGLPESLDLTDDADAYPTTTTTTTTITTTNQPREHIVTSPGMGGFRGYHASGLDVEVSY